MSLEAEILETLKGGCIPSSTPGHRQVSEVIRKCEESIANKKRKQQIKDLDNVIPSIRKLADAAGCLASQVDSFHESFPSYNTPTNLLGEIIHEVCNEWRDIDEGATKLEKIADEYEDKVEDKVNELLKEQEEAA